MPHTSHTWKQGPNLSPQRIGFISTRFSGTDGVSLESAKWAQVLREDGHQCFWFSGRQGPVEGESFCVPEAFFGHSENVWINERIWGRTTRSPLVSRRIQELAWYLKSKMYEFIQRFDLTLLIFENVQAIPMHIPLGVACSELIVETHIPAIGHHHDFYWERTRFSVSAATDILDRAFPPRDHDLHHVVINHSAQESLAHRKGIASHLIPNVLDFDAPPPVVDDYTADFRQEVGLAPDDIIILQPTRVVPRKGIEHAIQLVRLLDNPKCKLLITHEAGDEGLEYAQSLVKYAEQSGVDLRFIAARVGETRRLGDQGRKIYSLWDIYPSASLVTYPSTYEGFGNALLEAIYFKIPLVVHRYAIYARDIEPKGFKVPVFENFITAQVVSEVRRLLEDSAYRKAIVEHNFQTAKRFYSYTELRRHLRYVIGQIAYEKIEHSL